MATSLTQEEEQRVKEFIGVVNEIRVKRSIGPLSWNTAVKFMMARKFDVRRALMLYENHEITRYREGLAKFDPSQEPLRSELETGKFTVLPTHDSTGAAIAIFTASKHVPTDTSHKVTLQGLVYQLDVALESFDAQRCGVVFIYNMNGSKYGNFDYELSQKILNLLKGAYPARLKKVLIVMAPLWFKAPFKILRLFVREKLRDRVYMVNVSQLLLHIAPCSLPRDLGGNLSPDHKAWLLRCMKSIVNKCEDFNDINSLPSSPTQENGSILPYKDGGFEPGGYLANYGYSADADTDESSEIQSSIYEKQNSEDREKEVEVTKEGLTVETNGDCSKENEDSALLSPVSLATDFTEDEEKHYSSASGASSLCEETIHIDGGSGMTIEEFIQNLKQKGRKGLYEEYNEIKMQAPDGTFDISKFKQNQPKNRYTDVLCFDHSRVKLSIKNDDSHTDYINANFVDGYKQKNAFISTQGPLPRTFSDYWQMVWENNVLVIVMTTRTIERSRTKCGQYWPMDIGTSLEYGRFEVHNNGAEQQKDWILTSLTLTDNENSMARQVVHMQFSSWPDYGVPHSALAMLDFRDKVREFQARSVAALGSQWQGHALGPPIIVHCSAGIGRTGTFITLDICIQRLAEMEKINIRETVEKIRSQRAYSIQMPDQYVFCHLALLEYALSRGLLENVDLTGFEESDTESE